MENNKSFAILAIIGFSIIGAILLIPSQASDTIFFIQKDNSTPEPCSGNVGLVLAQNITDLCDVEVDNPLSTQLLEYNGTHWVNSNQSSATIVNSVTSDSNSTIGVVPTTGNVVLYPKWELLCETILTSNGTSLSCDDFPARSTLFIQIYVRSNGGNGVEPSLRFNNDTGNNYSFRVSTDNSADASSTSTSRCNLSGQSGSRIASGGANRVFGSISNINEDRKLAWFERTGGSDIGVTSSPGRGELHCKWGNTTDQITSITLFVMSGTGNFNSKTQLTVWGYN